MQASAHERIKPFGRVAVAGKDNSALAIQETAVPVVAAASGTGATAAPTDGKSAFDAACSACHGTGIAGAPRVGDKAAWAPRLAKGGATLEKHALEGFQGEAGVMPAKGGRTDLPDDIVRQAVEYMVAQSR